MLQRPPGASVPSEPKRRQHGFHQQQTSIYIYIYIHTLQYIYIYIYTLHARTVGAELRVTVGRKSAYDSLAGGLTVGATSTLLERFFTSINLKEF